MIPAQSFAASLTGPPISNNPFTVIAREFKSTQQGCCPSQLVETLAAISPGRLHRGQPNTVSLTQATDLGGVYAIDEIRTIAEVAKRRDLKLHMDGCVSPMRSHDSVAARRGRLGARALTSCRSAPPRMTARCAPRSSYLCPTSPRVSPCSPRGAARCLVPRLTGTAHYTSSNARAARRDSQMTRPSNWRSRHLHAPSPSDAKMDDHDLWMAFFEDPDRRTLGVMQEAPTGLRSGI
jgi:hypothetical protein